MGEKPDQIERHIQNQRDELGDNINELEQKVKSAFDWRAQFEEHPGVLLGAALAGGILLGAILPSASSVTSRVNYRRRSFSDPYTPYSNRNVTEAGESTAASGSSSPSYADYSERSARSASSGSSDTWNTLKNAAIGLASTRLTEYIEELVPGFGEHYRKAASQNPSQTRAASFGTRPYQAPGDEKSWQKPNGGTDYGSHS